MVGLVASALGEMNLERMGASCSSKCSSAFFTYRAMSRGERLIKFRGRFVSTAVLGFYSVAD